MIESLKKSFNAYMRNPLNFAWASLMYLVMLFVFFFAAVGVFLVYFIALSLLNIPFDMQSIPTMIILGLIGLAFIFFINGLSGSLAKAYHAAVWNEKTSITSFYMVAFDRAPESFAIQLLRDFIWLILCGPFIALYIYYLSSMPYMDYVVGIIVLVITFVLHMIFTPSFISAGAFGSGIYTALGHGISVLKRKHVMFFGLYILFAVLWLLNFVPIIQLVTIFFLYPIVYSSMVVMVENSGRPTAKPKK